jgi:hypothetical protein
MAEREAFPPALNPFLGTPESKRFQGPDPGPLTAREGRELKSRAAVDLSTISNYVSHLVAEDLRQKGRRRPVAGANPAEKRRLYSIALYLTAGERKRLEAAAEAERRSVSAYVARVILAELRA